MNGVIPYLREMNFVSVMFRLILAMVCGGMIGLERAFKRRPAGFRTHILICLGASLTTMTSQYLYLNMHYFTDMARLGAQVVAGIGFIGASPAVIAEFSKRLKAGLISADKLNQLRHVRFLPTIEAVKEHMKKHAEFLRPRFEAVERKLTEGLGDTGCATWTHPRGGYFVSFDGPEGSAQKVAALCADLGVKLTPAGATWPYGKDPRDTNIRIAPSYPTVEDLEAALDVLVLAVKLVAAELARAERA